MFQNAYAHRPLSGPMDIHQPATGRYQMIVGNGSHGQGLDKGIELEWYDTWLKGQRTNIKDTSTPLHLFEQGSNVWVNASTLPMDAKYTPYYLNSGGALTPTPPNAPDPGDSIIWAPPTTAGATLTYTTKPLARGATLAGPIAASVFASSSNANLELIADLYDVAPDGTATRVTTGDILGSLSTLDKTKSWYDENNLLVFPSHPYVVDRYVPAGQTQRYDMWLYPRIYAVAPGHSLRLVVSTQAALSSCNGSGAPLSTLPQPCFLTAPQKQTLPGGAYQVDHSRLHPSSINLPLLPYGIFRTAASAVTPTSGGVVESLDWGPPTRTPVHHRP
jgi:predicted acyl esterase